MALTGNTIFFPWEVALMEWLQVYKDSALFKLLSQFSLFGEELTLIMIVGFVYWCYDKRLGRTVGLTATMALIWNTMIKNIVQRRRPYFDHEGIEILRVVEPGEDIYDISAQGYSFPSAHSTNSAAVFGTLADNLRRRWATIAATVITLLTGISRFMVGAHYPTDVLLGWLLGIFSVAAVHLLQKRVKSTPALYGILLVFSVPGFFYCRSADYFTGMGLLIGFMGGTLFDDRFVHFENTKKPFWMAARMLGGLALYLVLNTALKMPFSKEFLSSGTTAALLVRCGRYAIVSFLGFGVYPVLFRFENRKPG